MTKRLLSDPEGVVLSLTNTLDFFTIKHIAANVPKTALEHLPKQFIAQVSNGKTEYIVMASKEKNETIKIQLSEDKTITFTENEFLNDWTGFILAIEENNAITKTTFSKENVGYGLLVLFALLLITQIGLLTHSILSTTFFLLSLLGVGLGYLIIREKIGKQTFASKFCKLGTNTNCESVLSSKSAIIYKNIDLSDAVVIYFTFTSIIFLIQPNSLLFFSISTLSLPIILYSLYQQYVTIKKRCPLCLGVAAILGLQFIALLPIYKSLTFHYNHTLVVGAVLGIVTFCWLTLKPLLYVQQKNNTLEIENLSFRRNHYLFLPYYNSLKQINTADNHIPQIVLGSKNPLVKLSIITNPFCKSCIALNDTYMNILKNFENSVQLSFMFLVTNKDREDTKTIVSERLIQLYFENDTATFLSAFNDWYDNTNTKKWTEAWGKCEDIKYNKILSEQLQWCLQHGIDNTPTILINGKLFPKNYNPKDIKDFIAPILEQQTALKTEKEINNIHA